MTVSDRPPLFRDPDQQAEFDAAGAVALRVLSTGHARELRAIFAALDPADGFNSCEALRDQVGGLHQTELDTNRSYKQRVIEIASQWLGTAVAEILIDYRVLTATLFVKSPDAAPLPIHADPTMQEDSVRPTMFLWCALQDVDETNGALRLVEGSHALFRDRTGVTINPGYFSCSGLLEERAATRRLAAGEAMLFDSSMFHGSSGNTTGEFRFAVRLTCIPVGQIGVMHRASPSDPELIETFRMEREDYINLDADGLLGGRFRTPKLGERRQPLVRISPPEMAAILDHAAEIRAGQTSIEAIADGLKRADSDRPQSGHLIHIGFPKCASTFIQRWFSEHPQIAYKPGLLGGWNGVHDLIADALGGPPGHRCRVTSSEALSDPRDPSTYGGVEIVSGEVGRRRMRRVCQELAALFPNARILMITRNQADMVVSGYSQIIKQGGSIGVADYIRIAREGFRDRHPFDYDRALKLYRSHFSDRVLALPYELLVDDRQAFLAAVADFSEVARFDIAADRVNESLDGEQLYWYPRIARMFEAVPNGWLRRKCIGLHKRMIRTGAWRPLIALLRRIAGRRSIEGDLRPELFRSLPIDCEELLKIGHYAPYHEIYRAGN